MIVLSTVQRIQLQFRVELKVGSVYGADTEALWAGTQLCMLTRDWIAD